MLWGWLCKGAMHTHSASENDKCINENCQIWQALDAAKTAINRFEQAGTTWQRPPDYYAEMVKSDDHMARVKEQLLFETKKIEDSSQRRKERESKRFAKQVSAERKKEKAQDKKSAITNVSALRKQRQKSGFAGDVDVDAELEKMERGQRQQNKSKMGERFKPRDMQSKRRLSRDAKFGFGGPKRASKQNDAFSAADVDGYRPAKFDDGVARKVQGKFGAKGGVAKKTGGKPQRPGKSKRQGGRGKK
jgi:rRNA-processing protein EBP2